MDNRGGVTGPLSKVYLLQHYYDYGKESEHEEVKELGVYSTRELAEEAIDRYKGHCTKR